MMLRLHNNYFLLMDIQQLIKNFREGVEYHYDDCEIYSAKLKNIVSNYFNLITL